MFLCGKNMRLTIEMASNLGRFCNKLATSITLALVFFSHITLANPMDQYPLHTAAKQNNVTEVERLLSASSPIEVRDQTGATPLVAATKANAIDAARVLINAGADVNAKDNIQDSAYLYAGARGHLEILKMTLANGADLKSTNRFGGTALIPAAERGHVETVQTLIDAGVAVDHVNRLGWTALIEAVILGDGGKRHQEIVAILLKAGANPNLADRDGVTPLQHAQKLGFKEIEDILLTYKTTK